jgi:hypothetical protein
VAAEAVMPLPMMSVRVGTGGAGGGTGGAGGGSVGGSHGGSMSPGQFA